jgi:hypothetical protein
MSDRQTSLDQICENWNNADVEQISVRHEILGSTPSLRLKKEEDGCCCVILWWRYTGIKRFSFRHF